MQQRFKGMCLEIARKIRTASMNREFNDKDARLFLWEFARLTRRELAKGNKVTVPGIGTFQANIGREFPRTSPENGLRRKLAHLRIKSRWNRPMIDYIRNELVKSKSDRNREPQLDQRQHPERDPAGDAEE